MSMVLILTRVAVGLVLGWAGVAKAIDPLAFQQAIAGFALVSLPVSAVVALVLPWLEIVLAVVLIMGSWGWRAALGMTWWLLALFTAVVVGAWARGLQPDCGCFGMEGGGPLWAMGRNSGLLVVVTVLWYAHGRRGWPVVPCAPRWGAWALRPTAVAALVMIAVGGWIGLRPSGAAIHNPVTAPTGSLDIPTRDPDGSHVPVAPPAAEAVHALEATTAVPSDAVRDWPSWTVGYRQQVLTQWLLRPTLPADEQHFLVQVVMDRTNDELTRNLAVDVLIGPGRQVPGLGQLLREQALDPRESMKWRDYAVQQMAQAARYDVDIEPTVHLLRTLAADRRSPYAGTALLGLVQLSMLQRVTLDRAFDDAVYALVADDQSTDAARLTAMLLAGERHIAAVLPMARALSAPDQAVGIRRAALRAVGAVGDASDDALFQEALASSHPLIVAAARAGYAQLLTRLRLAYQTPPSLRLK